MNRGMFYLLVSEIMWPDSRQQKGLEGGGEGAVNRAKLIIFFKISMQTKKKG